MGAALPKPVVSTVVERHGSKGFRVGMAEMNGWRTSMEDAHVVHYNERWGYFGVLDGHGGDACSGWCARRIVEKLGQEGCPQSDAAAKKLVLSVDQEFLETEQSSGSTAAMCIVHCPAKAGDKYKLHVVNAGDSRVVLSRADGSIVDGGGSDEGLSVDHKPDHPSERERIYRCGGHVQEAAAGPARVNGDLSVSRGFGDAEYKKTGGPGPEDRPVTADPEMGHFECDGSDFLLIVCDGVSEGQFTNPEVCALAAEVLRATNGDAGRAAEAVIFRALERNSKDNITCMIILMGDGNGSGYAYPPGKGIEFNPGPLLAIDDSSFNAAYGAMCERGGLTLSQAADKRHTLLVSRAGGPDEEPEDGQELAKMGSPAGGEGSEERTAWFQKWTEEQTNKPGNDEEGGGPPGMGAGGGDQRAMMQMLMGMMQQRGQMGGPDEPGV